MKGRKQPSQGVGQKIRAARQRRRLSTAQAAEILGIDPSTWWRWERGRTPLTTERLGRIAALLGCRPADLLPG